jgi:hypothetical protein
MPDDMPEPPPHPAAVEWKRAIDKAVEQHNRYLRVKRMMVEAYQAGFEKSFPAHATETPAHESTRPNTKGKLNASSNL